MHEANDFKHVAVQIQETYPCHYSPLVATARTHDARARCNSASRASIFLELQMAIDQRIVGIEEEEEEEQD